jgi:hypothetical protein
VGGVLTSEVLGVDEALGEFEIIRVGNNQTGNLMVIPGRLGVAMYGEPKFPKEGKVKGSLGQRFSPLVLLGVDSINTDTN